MIRGVLSRSRLKRLKVQQAIERFSEADLLYDGAYWKAIDAFTGHFQNWGWWNWATKQMTMSVVMLGSSMVTVILIYLSLTATTFKDPKKKDSPELLEARRRSSNRRRRRSS
jgi:hypothetical protein